MLVRVRRDPRGDDGGVYYIDLTNATTDDYRDLKSWTTTTSHATSTGDSDHTLISTLDDNFAGKYVIGYGNFASDEAFDRRVFFGIGMFRCDDVSGFDAEEVFREICDRPTAVPRTTDRKSVV